MNKTKKRAHKRAQDKAREAYVQKIIRQAREKRFTTEQRIRARRRPQVFEEPLF